MRNTRYTTDRFITRAIEVHGDKYNYDKSEYTRSVNNVIIICKEHGEFEQAAGRHLNGSGCKKCANERNIHRPQYNTEVFIKLATEKHNGKYNYDKTVYVNTRTKILIQCPTHGEFEQVPNSHLRGYGCVKCGRERKIKNQTHGDNDFIRRVSEIHEDKYNYNKVVYKGAMDKVIITCPEHGDFLQIPAHHLQGKGCYDCGVDVKRRNPKGWNVEHWKRAAKDSKFFDEYKVYVARLYNDNEDFFKVGRTFRTLKKRLRYVVNKYKYEVLYSITFENPQEAIDLENEFKNILFDFKVSTEKEFDGMYECFSTIDPIKSTLTKLTKNN